MNPQNLLKFDPAQQFIKEIGSQIKKYFGKEKGCIIYLLPDGIFYGQALYKWLNNKKNITITTMDDDGKYLQEEKIRGRKILVVDNDIVTSKGYKRAMEALRLRKESLHIKDVKFAVFVDRTGLADFSVEGYSADAPWSIKNLDAIDLKIIKLLSQDGRKSFMEIAKETKLSGVGVKKRLEKLINQKILSVQGLLNLEKFYSLSAQLTIEADDKTISELIGKLEKSPFVYHLIKTSGKYNLVVGIVTPNLETIESFVLKEIRVKPGIKNLEVNIGELPIIPKGLTLPIT